MTKPYPMELRERAVRFVEAGESRHAVAARLGISPSCVIKWLDLLSQDRQCEAGQDGRPCAPQDIGRTPGLGFGADRGRAM